MIDNSDGGGLDPSTLRAQGTSTLNDGWVGVCGGGGGGEVGGDEHDGAGSLLYRLGRKTAMLEVLKKSIRELSANFFVYIYKKITLSLLLFQKAVCNPRRLDVRILYIIISSCM